MKDLKHQKESKSYMQFCLYLEGKEKIYLMVPTFWNPIRKNWFGFVKTPITKKILSAEGENSKELEDNFNIALHKFIEESGEEAFNMFKPLEYWDTRL